MIELAPINTDIFTIIYYFFFIVLTILAVTVSIRSYINQKKKNTTLYSRVDYGFSGKTDRNVNISLEILNDGDYLCQDVNIEILIGNEKLYRDEVRFIGPHKMYRYYIGTLNVPEKKITWINGDNASIESIQESSLFETKCEEKNGEWKVLLITKKLR